MTRPRTTALFLALLVALAGSGIATAAEPAPAPAQPGAAPEAEAESDAVSLWQVIKWGGTIELIIILCSLAAMTLIIEHFVTIRFGKAMPQDLVERTAEKMKNREYSDVLSLCRDRPCFFANVMVAGLQRLRHDFSAVQEAVADTIEKQGLALHAKISYLSFIFNVCPMLGLLGTVWGMIRAFNKIAYHQGLGRSKLLAEGVSQALITTATGLVVAIPVMAFFFFFRERVNRIIIEVETLTTDLFEPFRPGRKVEEDWRFRAATAGMAWLASDTEALAPRRQMRNGECGMRNEARNGRCYGYSPRASTGLTSARPAPASCPPSTAAWPARCAADRTGGRWA